jgi:TetR/AcrR family transcriptional regulator, transcriptional repressor of aconitase
MFVLRCLQDDSSGAELSRTNIRFTLERMPRVSEQHLAARREQVLQAAWACFSRNGFHATTMADVIAESGLSAGAVYRYFDGKAALVEATADRALGAVGGTLAELLAADEAVHPVDAVERILETVERMAASEPTDISRIALMAWAESLRSHDIHKVTNSAMTRLRGSLAELTLKARDAGRLAPTADPGVVAMVMMSLVVGWVVQGHIAGVADRKIYLEGIRDLLGAT